MSDIDNADKIFEEEPDNRDEFQRALDEVEPELRPHFKVMKGLVGSIYPATTFTPKDFEYRCVLFSLSPENLPHTQKSMEQLLNVGWSPRSDLILEHEGIFLVTFEREKQPVDSVKSEPADSVPKHETDSVEKR